MNYLEDMKNAANKTERAAKRAEMAARVARMEAARQAVIAIVATGACPDCGRALKRNGSLSGWWQCSQFGAEGFRADSNAAACGWQGFTE